jgi:drug/metabolite transporter (DMT)-like permease
VSIGLWAVFTVVAAFGQTLRNAMQKELTATLGTVGATHVRFLFGLPFVLLFLTGVLAASGYPLPTLNGQMLVWTAIGAGAQIAATALLLAALKQKSFVVTTALITIEPVHVALFGLVFLGDALNVPLIAAILIACAGVLIMSWPKDQAAAVADGGWQPALLGIASGAMFGISATGFRGGILALGHPNFVVAATTTLAVGIIMQTTVLTAYLWLFERERLMAIFRAWRPSVYAGFLGAFASQMWFLAFALESAAKVRTLALVEIFFAQIVSRSMFKQGLASREGLGIALVVVGVIILLNV